MSEFVPRNIGNRNCDAPITGTAHPNYDYIARSTTGDSDYPVDACARYLQTKANFDFINVLGGGKNINSAWLDAELATARALPVKPFDISHPTKKGYRLRHVSLEGPEIGVYYRGALNDNNIIEIPDYWDNLIDPTSITVNLTPTGSYQELFVEKIEWGKKIIVKNREGGAINCYYTVYAERKDYQKLVVEYEGESMQDYPGEDFLGINDLKRPLDDQP
jgi:hypothetical protein